MTMDTKSHLIHGLMHIYRSSIGVKVSTLLLSFFFSLLPYDINSSIQSIRKCHGQRVRVFFFCWTWIPLNFFFFGWFLGIDAIRVITGATVAFTRPRKFLNLGVTITVHSWFTEFLFFFFFFFPAAYGDYNDQTIQVANSRKQTLVTWDFEYELFPLSTS